MSVSAPAVSDAEGGLRSAGQSFQLPIALATLLALSITTLWSSLH